MVRWARQVELRRGKKVAIVALARKTAGIMFAIWRDGSTYDSRRGAARETSRSAEVTTAARTLVAAGHARA